MIKEVTEKLLVENEEKKKRPKKKFLGVLVVLLIILAVGLTFYFWYKSNRYETLLNEASTAFAEESYDEALEKYTEAIKVNSNGTEGYEGILEVSKRTGNTEQVLQVKEKLFELTGEEKYDPDLLQRAKEAYKAHLLELYKEVETSISSLQRAQDYNYISLFDVDEDGVPELFAEVNYGGNASDYFFFTYKDGEVIQIGNDHALGLIFKGEDNSDSGKLYMYRIVYGDMSHEIEQSYLNFDGKKVTYEQLQSGLKDISSLEGYEIEHGPLSSGILD